MIHTCINKLVLADTERERGKNGQRRGRREGRCLLFKVTDDEVIETPFFSGEMQGGGGALCAGGVR